jgi:hypothetical protein
MPLTFRTNGTQYQSASYSNLIPTAIKNIVVTSTVAGQVAVNWSGGLGNNVKYTYSVYNNTGSTIVSPTAYTISGANPTTITMTDTAANSYNVTVTANVLGGSGNGLSNNTAIISSSTSSMTVIATILGTTATITFNEPSLTIDTYTVTCYPGEFTNINYIGPLHIQGLTVGSSYTFTITATDVDGTSQTSDHSNPVTAVFMEPATTTLLQTYSMFFTTVGDSTYGQYIACSSNGQYVTAVCNGAIYYSSNYGSTFTSVTVSTNMYCVAMSGNGQYQVACSTGVPACNIYVSSNYGVNWLLAKNETTNNSGRWIQAVCCDVTGQYMYTADGGWNGNNNCFWSKDFGITWAKMGTPMIGNRTGCTINNSTFKVYAVAGQGSCPNALLSYLLTDVAPKETLVLTLPFEGQWITSNGGNSIFYTTVQFTGFYSSDGGNNWSSELIVPDTFISVWYNSSATRLWGATSSILYYSTNNGTSWTPLSTNLTNMFGFNMSSDGSKLFILTQTGSIHTMDISGY